MKRLIFYCRSHCCQELVLMGVTGRGAISACATIRFQQTQAYICDEGLEEVGLVPQWVVDQPIAEGDNPMGEVVLC